MNEHNTCSCGISHRHIHHISKRDRLIMAGLTLILGRLFLYKIIAHALFLSGINYYDADLKDKAYKQFKKAIRIDNKFDDGYVWIGRIHHEQGDEEKAIEYYKKALSINKKNIEAYNDLGLIYLQERDFKKIIEDISTILTQDLKLKEYQKDLAINTLKILATAFREESKKEKAILCYKKILKINPNEEYAKWQLKMLEE